VDSYRPLDYQVFVLRFWREAASGTWRGQIVHLPDQQAAAFANWEQAQTFVGRFVSQVDGGDLSSTGVDVKPA
jgi:hypothetical protein